MRQAGWIGVVFAFVLFLAGCGSNKSAPAPSSESVKKPTVATSGPAGVKSRLSGVGYVVTDRSPGTGNPPATAALDVALTGGGKVTILFYESAADATRAAKPFVSIEGTNPKQFELRETGPRLYVGTIEEPATLRTQAFNAIVAAAEGR